MIKDWFILKYLGLEYKSINFPFRAFMKTLLYSGNIIMSHFLYLTINHILSLNVNLPYHEV